MIKYEDLYNEVKNNLSEKRFNHSKGVVDRALEYADIYNVDKDKVKLTAIAHDNAKELSNEEVDKYIKKYNIKLDDIEKNNKNLIHSIIGAYICRDKYNFDDDMMNAIRYHTTGRANMSMLEKIIYLADATEKSRGYSDMDWYVNIIKEDIDRGMVEVSKWVIESLLKNNKQIHNSSIECYNYYIKEIK
ncbi:MAG: bis(5'-nucleosyl)-tetraphosphatase (symmetrical) YqeK [Bacilli bacterium]|nr:bis(5'-nucleosyl)-tetraphosphatase (symmetrical) YqeK [Bacilli bacterium]